MTANPIASPQLSRPTPFARLAPVPPASHCHAAPVTGMSPKASIAYPRVYLFTATGSNTLTTAVSTPRYVSSPRGSARAVASAAAEPPSAANEESSAAAQIAANAAVVPV